MTDEQFDETFQRMRTELNVTPSPEFVVKVRRQNEQAPSRRGWSVWAWAGVAATCTAAVIAVAVWPSPAPQPQVEAVQNRPRESVSPIPEPSESFSPVQKPTPEVGFVARTPSPAIATLATTTELDILVPPDQLIGIRRLMSSLRTGVSVQLAPPQTLIDPDTGELIVPKPIEIPLIAVTPLPGDPEGRSGGRENR